MKVTQSSLTLCYPKEFSRSEYWSGYFPSPGCSPNPGIEPRSPALQVDSLPAEPQGKPKNTAVGSLTLSPTDLPNPEIELGSPALQACSLSTELSGKPSKGQKLSLFQIPVPGIAQDLRPYKELWKEGKQRRNIPI